jgi:hypothetical protein
MDRPPRQAGETSGKVPLLPVRLPGWVVPVLVLASLLAVANSMVLANNGFAVLAPWAWLPFGVAGLCTLAGLVSLWPALRLKRYWLVMLALLSGPWYPAFHLTKYGWPLNPAQAAARKQASLANAPIWPRRYYLDRVDYYDQALAPYLLGDTAYARQLATKLTQTWGQAGTVLGRPALSYHAPATDLAKLAVALYLARRYQGQTPAQALADEAGSRILLLLGNTNCKNWYEDAPDHQPWLMERLKIKRAKYPLGYYDYYQPIEPALWATHMAQLAQRPAQLDTLACRWLLDELTHTPLRVPPTDFNSLIEHWLKFAALEQPEQVRALAALRNQVHTLAPSLAVNDTLPVDFSWPAQRPYYQLLQPWLVSAGWWPRLDTLAQRKLVINLQLDSTYIGTGLVPVYKSVTRTREVTKTRQVPRTSYNRRSGSYTTYHTETYYATESYTDLEKEGEQPVNYYTVRLRLQVGPDPAQLGKALVINQYQRTPPSTARPPSNLPTWLYGLGGDWY